MYLYIYIWIYIYMHQDASQKPSHQLMSPELSSFEEHALDQTWRFLLELLGLFERLDEAEAEASETGWNGETMVEPWWNHLFFIGYWVYDGWYTLWFCQNSYWRWSSRNTEFSHSKWWCSIVLLCYQRVMDDTGQENTCKYINTIVMDIIYDMINGYNDGSQMFFPDVHHGLLRNAW